MLEKANDTLDPRIGAFADPYEDTEEGSAEDLASLGIRVNRSTGTTPLHVSAIDS